MTKKHKLEIQLYITLNVLLVYYDNVFFFYFFRERARRASRDLKREKFDTSGGGRVSYKVALGFDND